MRRGFTLIETLIYLALFTIIIGGLVASAYAFFESIGRNQSHAMLQEEQNFLIGKIDWVLSGAKVITVPAANASGNTLTVTKYDGTTNTLSFSSGSILLNGTALNTSNITVNNVLFIRDTESGTNAPDGVEAGITISMLAPNGMTISETATTTRFIRK